MNGSARVKLGGFLEPIGHFKGRKVVISVTKGVEHDKRNPPLQKLKVFLESCLMRVKHPKQLYLWNPEGANGSIYESTSSKTEDSQDPGYRETMLSVLILGLTFITNPGLSTNANSATSKLTSNSLLLIHPLIIDSVCQA